MNMQPCSVDSIISMDKTLKFLPGLVAENRHLLSASEHVDLGCVEAREVLISQLTSAGKLILEIYEEIGAAILAARSAQLADARAAEAVLAKLTGTKTARPVEWSVVERRRPSRLTRTIVDPGMTEPRGHAMIPITDGLSLPAIIVSDFGAVKSDGSLYWVSSCDHFALKIAGQLFHGNVGSIFTDDKSSPEKIKDCRFAGSCSKNGMCDYYHDPVRFPGSRDRRNFFASSWLYAPPMARAARLRGRRFGSRDHLDNDIISVQDDEISRGRDQCMHDILCALVLAAARASR